LYLLAGSAWAVFITLLSFQFSPADPVKRSIAKIWSANTALLDAILSNDQGEVIKREMEVRKLINLSIDLFERPGSNNSIKMTGHYNILMDLRKNAALFSATLSALHQEMDVLTSHLSGKLKDASPEKTISSFAQASARMAIVTFTSRPEDLTIANVRVKRCEVAIEVLKEATGNLKLPEKETRALRHFISTLYQAFEYLKHSGSLLQEKLEIGKSDRSESYRLSMHSFAMGLNRQTFGNFIQNFKSIDVDQLRYALRASVALCVGVFLFKFFNIDHGYWIPLTIIIVIQPYYGATRKKGLERIIGTVAGTILGGLVMLLPLPHFAFIILLVAVSFLVAYYLRNNYKVGVFYSTVMMVVLMQLSQHASWSLIGWRVLSTLLGALLAFAASYAFWPVWERQRFPVLMGKAVNGVKNYLEQVILFYNGRLPPHESWYKGRRLAEAANNTLFSSVQRMHEEPVHAQSRVDTCFALVGIIIRITREITSIALLAQQAKNREPSQVLELFSEHASVLLTQLTTRIGEEQGAPEPDFEPLKKILRNPRFTNNEQHHMVVIELEKIIFELEALFRMETSLHGAPELAIKKAEVFPR
jgi:uncharacterized membrane protein YccC